MRQRERPEPDPPELPPELAACYVEEWSRPEDEANAGRLLAASSSSAPEDRGTAVAMLAWQRWKAARREWATAAGVELRGGSGPRWKGQA